MANISKPKDPAQALKAITAADSPPSYLLIVSPDRTRRERIVNNILKKFCKSYSETGKKAENISVSNAEDLNAGNIQVLIDEINSISLFSQQKFILINNIDEMPAALNKKILDFLKAGNPGSCIIFSAKKMAANSVIYNFFKKNDSLIELTELKNQDLSRWVQKELKSAGVAYKDEILPEALIQSAESDPDKIIELIERLSLFTDDAQSSLEDLSELSKQAPDASEFTLIDQLPNKKILWKSELLLNQIFKSGKNSFALLGLISRTYNNYLQMAYLRESGLNQHQIRQKLNLSPWLFNKQYEVSKNYTVKHLLQSLKAILLADSKLKNKSLGDEGIFSELIQNL